MAETQKRNHFQSSHSLKLGPKKVIGFVFGDFFLEALAGALPDFVLLLGINCTSKLSHLCLHSFTTNLIWTFQNDPTSLHFCFKTGSPYGFGCFSNVVFPFSSLGIHGSAENPTRLHVQANFPSPSSACRWDPLICVCSHLSGVPFSAFYRYLFLPDNYCPLIVLKSSFYCCSRQI